MHQFVTHNRHYPTQKQFTNAILRFFRETLPKEWKNFRSKVSDIFVALNVAEGQWRTVNSTYGITRLVSFGKEPAAVPLDLVSQLMLRCDADGKVLPPKMLKPGDQVALNTGPFANFVAEVEKIAPDRRVWVLMDIMGGQTRVAVGADQLREI
jgi:transcriptional antiterminator RfaH